MESEGAGGFFTFLLGIAALAWIGAVAVEHGRRRARERETELGVQLAKARVQHLLRLLRLRLRLYYSNIFR